MAIGVETADCVPVLLVDPLTPAVGAVHSGWRSTVKRIVQGEPDLGDWGLQLNHYRQLLESKGFPVDRMVLQAIVRDGGTYLAKKRGLARNIYLIDVPRQDDDGVTAYFAGKRDALKAALETNTIPPLCSNDERWQDRKCAEFCRVAEFCDRYDAYSAFLDQVTADANLKAQFVRYPAAITTMIAYNNAIAPFTDKNVRIAFSQAFDREGWVKDVLKGLGSPTLTWIPKGFPGYDPNEDRFKYDPAKAKQVLADAGYTVGADGILAKGGKQFPITLTFSDTPRNRTRNEWLAAKYKEILGVDLKLNPVLIFWLLYEKIGKSITNANKSQTCVSSSALIRITALDGKFNCLFCSI